MDTKNFRVPLNSITSKRNFSKRTQQGFSNIATEGALWNLGLAASNKAITLVGQVMLAWLLTPADMGFAGMALAIVGFTTFLSAGGLGDVLLQRGRYKAEAGQGLWLSIILSLIVSFLILIISFSLEFTDRRNLSGLLLILAFASLSSFLNPILGSKLKSHLDFKHLAISHFLEGITYTLFAILFAYMGFGPYSLIIPVIPRGLIGAFYIVRREGFPPLVKPKYKIIKNLLLPTTSLALTGFLFGLQTQAPILLLGLITTPTETGYFVWGYSVASQAVFLLAINLRNVLMPIFVKLNDHPERQINAVLNSARVMTAVLVIAVGLQAMLADPILKLFSLGKWLPSGPIITYVSLGLVLQGFTISISSWLNAVGKYKSLLLNNAIPALIISLLTIIGDKFWGINGAALGTGLGLTFGSFFSLSHVPWQNTINQFKVIAPPLILTVPIWIFFYLQILKQPSLYIIFLYSFFYLVSCGIVWWYWNQGIIKKVSFKNFNSHKG